VTKRGQPHKKVFISFPTANNFREKRAHVRQNLIYRVAASETPHRQNLRIKKPRQTPPPLLGVFGVAVELRQIFKKLKFFQRQLFRWSWGVFGAAIIAVGCFWRGHPADVKQRATRMSQNRRNASIHPVSAVNFLFLRAKNYCDCDLFGRYLVTLLSRKNETARLFSLIE